MRNLVLFLTILLCSCASLKNDLKAKGYSDADIELIKPHFNLYNRQLITFQPFVGATINAATEQNLKTIFCNCYKKHGELCRKPSAELGDQDKTLWAKSNAAEMALKAQNAGDITRAMSSVGTLDSDACPQ